MGRPPKPEDEVAEVQNVRVPKARWVKLAEEAERAGTNRSRLLNAFAAWYTREPGAKAVKRPDPVPETLADDSAAGE